jgi:hypothetical protein
LLTDISVPHTDQIVTIDGHKTPSAMLLGSWWPHLLHSSSAHSHGLTCINFWRLEHGWM